MSRRGRDGDGDGRKWWLGSTCIKYQVSGIKTQSVVLLDIRLSEVRLSADFW